jgi:hypothetical protein
VRKGWITGVLVVVVVALLVLFVWKPFGGPQEHDLNDAERGFSVTISDGWHSEEPEDDPNTLFVAWNGKFAPSSDPIDCDEERAFKARVWVMNAFPGNEPNRAPGARFDESSGTGLVAGTAGYECGEREQSIVWSESGRRLQAGVLVGNDAGSSSLEDAYDILNSLHIEPQ